MFLSRDNLKIEFIDISKDSFIKKLFLITKNYIQYSMNKDVNYLYMLAFEADYGQFYRIF